MKTSNCRLFHRIADLFMCCYLYDIFLYYYCWLFFLFVGIWFLKTLQCDERNLQLLQMSGILSVSSSAVIVISVYFSFLFTDWEFSLVYSVNFLICFQSTRLCNIYNFQLLWVKMWLFVVFSCSFFTLVLFGD